MTRLGNAALLIVASAILFCFIGAKGVLAATSPTLGESGVYSVLGASTVTNTGSTTTNGAVGVSAGTAITGFPPGTAGGGIHSNDASAIAAQADNLTVFGTLNQTCDQSFGAQDLTLLSPLGPGVYCSTSSFSLSGNLTLTGTGSGVYIFKSVSTLITSPGSSVTGGDACNVWWRVGSSATLDTTTSFIGNIFALTSVTMNSGASLAGRALVQTGAVTLSSNTITSYCVPSSSFSSASSVSSSGNSTSVSSCPNLSSQVVTPIIIQSKRTSPTSIFLSWGPYSGTDNFNVRYGLTNGNWLYNTNVVGFSTTINDLPPNQPIWVQVAARNSCSIGSYSNSLFIGGPRLPNTGIGPTYKFISPNLVILIGVGLLFLALILKKIWYLKNLRN